MLHWVTRVGIAEADNKVRATGGMRDCQSGWHYLDGLHVYSHVLHTGPSSLWIHAMLVHNLQMLGLAYNGN